MSAAAWTAVGTLVLAAMTLAAVVTTIVITRTDRSRADARLKAERDAACEREQEADAWAVEVIPKVQDLTEGWYLDADVTNLGSFTITRVQAMFSPDGKSLIAHGETERIREHDAGASGGSIANFTQSGYQGILTRGTGMRFWSDPMSESAFADPYPVVRWTDKPGRRRGAVVQEQRNALSPADPCVAARRVIGRLLGLSQVSWLAHDAVVGSDALQERCQRLPVDGARAF